MPVRSCYEAGRDGFWLHRYLVRRGIVRARAINTAWAWLRFQPTSALTTWYQQKCGHGSSRVRKIGIVALARKLLIAFW